MNKSARNILLWMALAAGICSCNHAEFQTPDDGMVRFSVKICSDEMVKSSYAGDENTVNNYKVFAYRSGSLVDSGYCSNGDSSLSFALPVGSYDFYVLCNMGDVGTLGSFPDNYRCNVGSASAMLTWGIPMAAKQTVNVTVGMSSLELDVMRLVAKYNLYVQRNFEDTNSTFTVTGAKVCQAAADMLAFSDNSTPCSVLTGDKGDYASADDLSCLNTSVKYDSTTGAVSFFMFENARGTLLPGNTDPWKKCYDSYGGLLSSADSQKCTYLEVAGIWNTSGASEIVTYRMFLGRDNCTNFDILRNRESNVTLILSDTGKERDSWKVEDVTDFDTRSIAWSRTSMQMYRPGAYYATLSITPADMVHNIYYASNPSSPSWQKLTETASGHVGYTDEDNLLTLDYNMATHMLTMTAAESSSSSDPFLFAVKARTTDGKASSNMSVSLSTKVDYVFHRHWSAGDAKYVYSHGATMLELSGNSEGKIESAVNIKYEVGKYNSSTAFEVVSSDKFSVKTSEVRSDKNGVFYFDPSGNRAYYYTTYGTSDGSARYYLRVYLNGVLKEEQEIHSLNSWFVPSGNHVYKNTDFLDQSDYSNPPVLFVENEESVYLKLYDPVENEIISPRLLFLPPNMLSAGSSMYANCDWDYNDMEENGITYNCAEDPEDHDLYFEFTKEFEGETSFWEIGYNHSSANAVMRVITCGSIPDGNVTEVNIMMPAMVDNACAGSVSGQSTVSVDFSTILSSDRAAGPSTAPYWLKFSLISSYGYLPPYDSSNPTDPYGLSMSYSRTSGASGKLTFRKSFCGDLALYWEDVTYGSSGKTGYRYVFTFKVRSVFDIGVIYVPVYLPKSPDTAYGFSPVLGKVSTYYENMTNRGVIRMYPMVKDGTGGSDVFESLVTYMKMKDYYTAPCGSYQWIPFSDSNAELHEALLSARVSSESLGTYDKIRVSHTANSVSDIVGNYDWTTDNSVVDDFVRQTYTGTNTSGYLVVTSKVSKNTLTAQPFSQGGVCLRLNYTPAYESALLQPGQCYEFNDDNSCFYFKANVVSEFYNDRFDAWPWNKIVYE